MFSALLAIPLLAIGQAASDVDTSRGEAMVDACFQAETARLRDACLADVQSLDDWKVRRDEYRRQLLEMLGLDPLPERTDLKATATGRVEHEGFFVEKVHFQSRPGLYVTGNLYVPKGVDKPLPAVLYVCGHGALKKDGVSFGNKVSYQRHGCWFATNGYVCLTIDSLQLGEIEATHHGTYRYGMWWWNNRGYSPAGVEAWNCVRALDYLETRPEVDATRLGVTGRSGGGAYSWWIAAIDERIRAAVPVAGITDLDNHVVTGCVEGHCDCMYFVNTYRWDYPLVAALVAPRPLMIGNSDADGIFPLDGVTRTYEKARRVYDLYGAADKIALNVTEGGHKDTPELRIPAFRWFNEHLKGEDTPVEDQPEGFFEPEQLKVFDELPADQLNTEIHETFVAAASPPVPDSRDAWAAMRDEWRESLVKKAFRGWPNEPGALDVEKVGTIQQRGRRVDHYEFTSQGPVRLPLFVATRPDTGNARRATIRVLNEAGWQRARSRLETDSTAWVEDGTAPVIYVCPRGIGPTAWYPSERKQVQIRRRFMLLGQTLDGMRVWDVRRAVEAIRSMPQFRDAELTVAAQGTMAGVALYAALFDPDLAGLELDSLPSTHREGPILLNVRRYLDVPQAVAMAAERTPVEITTGNPSAWAYTASVMETLGHPDRLRLTESPPLAPATPTGP